MNSRTSVSALAWAMIILVSQGVAQTQPVQPPPPSATQPAEILTLVRTIKIPNITGRIGHMAFDAKRNRLFVAAMTANTVEVIDLQTGEVAERIPAMSQPTDVAFLPELDVLVVTSAGHAKCVFLDPVSLAPVKSIDRKTKAELIRYDAATKKLYLGFGNAIAVIDAQTGESIGEIALEGHPSGFVVERSGQRAYVNVPLAKHVAVVDLQSNAVIDKWPLDDITINHPMAIDEANHRLFVGCRKPARLLVFDTNTGKNVQSLQMMGDCDDMFFEPSTRRLYASCGAGVIDVFGQIDPDHYELLARVPTATAARTSLFVQDQRKLYVIAPPGRGGETELRIFETSPASP